MRGIKEDLQTKDNRVNLKISKPIHHMLLKASGDLNLSAKAYTEAAVLFFASRRLDPSGFKEGDTYRVIKHVDKGIDRVISYLVTQEQGVLEQVFSELVNTRIVCEILLSNLHKLSHLSAEEAEKLNAYNNAYIKTRKKSIRQTYHKK